MADRALAVAAWESLFRAQVTVMRAISADFPSETMSITEYDVLFNLSRAPGRRLRLRDLTRVLLITQPSVSRLVDRLVARGCLRKLEDPSDGRGTIVALTEEGYDAFRRIAVQHVRSIDAAVGSALDDDELRDLMALCDKLRQGIGSDPARPRRRDDRSAS